MKKQLSVAVAAALASGLYLGAAQAVTLSGATVEYTFDETDPGLALFGSFSITGDKLVFDPTGFVATTSTMGNVVTNATTPTITVKAKAGFTLTEARLLEDGDYFRLGDAAATGVGVGGQFRVNGSAIQFPAQDLSATTSFSSFSTTPWTVDLTGALTGDDRRWEPPLLRGRLPIEQDDR